MIFQYIADNKSAIRYVISGSDSAGSIKNSVNN
jgi:hypothetical protein